MEHNNHPDLDLQHDEMNNNLPRIHSKKSLSKFGPFNNQSSSHLTTNNLSGNNNNNNNDSDEEDYGKHFDPSFGPAPIKKEIILPIQPKSDINDDDNEDYGRFDPSFGPAPIKKDLMSPASSEAIITALRREPSDDEDYGGHFDPSFGPAPIKKDLISLGSSEGLASVSSKGGQSQSNNKKKDKGGDDDDDDEDYGHFDPSFGPAPIKKDLISPASSEAITTNLRREPSDDEDYGGHFDPSFGPAPIKKEGIQVPSSSSNNSHQGSGSAAGGGGEEDDDYGDIDPNYKADHVAKTSSGNFIVLPEIQKKTIKKTLSKYGGSSSQQLTSGNSFSTMKKTESSDNEDYGIKHANNNHDEFGTIPIRQTRIPLSASSPKNSAYIFDDQRKMSFQKMTLESDEDEEDYGTLDPNYKAEKVAVTSSGHFVVLPESNENSKKIKKTLSKYGNSPDAKQPDPFKPVISPNIASKKDDSDEEYGPIVSDTPQQNQRKQKDFRANGTGDKKVTPRSQPAILPLTNFEIKSKQEELKSTSTDALDMSLNALTLSLPIEQDLVEDYKPVSPQDRGTVSLLSSASMDYSDPGISYESKLISLIGKGYTKEQAEEYLTSFTPRTVLTRPSHDGSIHHFRELETQPRPHSLRTVKSLPANYSTDQYVDSSIYHKQPAAQENNFPPHDTFDQEEVDALMVKGYTLEQALTILASRHPNVSQNAQSTNNSIYPSSQHSTVPILSPSPRSAEVVPSLPRYNPYMPYSPLNNVRDADEQALRIAMLVSEQEAEFGLNMYQVLEDKDEPEVQQLVNRGFTVDEAILWLFEKKGYILKKNQEPSVINQDLMGGIPRTIHTPPLRRKSDLSETSTLTKSPASAITEIKEEKPKRRSSGSISSDQKKPEKEKEKPSNSIQKIKSLFGLTHESKEPTTAKSSHQPKNEEKHPKPSKLKPAPSSRSKSHHKTWEEKERQRILGYQEKDVRMITELGFSKEQAVQALIQNNHNVTLATNSLIQSLRENNSIRRSHSNDNSYQGNPGMIGLNPYSYPYPLYYPYPVPQDPRMSYQGSIGSISSEYYPPPPYGTPNQSRSYSNSTSASIYEQMSAQPYLVPSSYSHDNFDNASRGYLPPMQASNDSFYRSPSGMQGIASPPEYHAVNRTHISH